MTSMNLTGRRKFKERSGMSVASLSVLQRARSRLTIAKSGMPEDTVRVLIIKTTSMNAPILSNLLSSRMAKADVANSVGGLAYQMRKRAICAIPVQRASLDSFAIRWRRTPDRAE